MADRRFYSPLLLSVIALIFSITSLVGEKNVSLLVAILIVVQSVSLITALNYPRISTVVYSLSFGSMLLLGHSTGFELFLGVFLVSVIAANGNFYIAILVAAIITLGGFYSPTNGRFTFDIGAIIIFLTIMSMAYLLGMRIHHNHQQRLANRKAQRNRHQQLISLLHDTIAADLTSLITQIETLSITTPERQKELKKIAQTARHALTRTRKLLITLNAHHDDYCPAAFPSTLEAFAKRLRAHNFVVTTTTNLTTPVSATTKTTALERVLNEMAANIIKYAIPGTSVIITASSNNDGVTITAKNTTNPNQKRLSKSTNLGLNSMAQTLHAVGGTLTTTSLDQQWTTIVYIPL